MLNSVYRHSSITGYTYNTHVIGKYDVLQRNYTIDAICSPLFYCHFDVRQYILIKQRLEAPSNYFTAIRSLIPLKELTKRTSLGH